MANDVHQLIIAGRSGGEFWETVQHYANDTTASANPVTDSQSLIDGFINNVQEFVLAAMSASTTIFGYKAKRVNNGGGPTVINPTVETPGEQAGDQLPAANAYCLTTRYSDGTNWRAGKWFLPGIPEAYTTGNGYTAPAIAAIADIVIANSGFTESPRTWAYGTWSATGGVFYPPTYVNLSPKIGIQRRRLLPVL